MSLVKHMLAFLLSHLLLLKAHSKCPQSFQCGDQFHLQFPFTDINFPKCGVFKVEGCNGSVSNPIIKFEGFPSVYRILGMNSPNKLKVMDYHLHLLLDQSICFPFTNMSLPNSPSFSFSIPSNLTLFTCTNHTFDQQIQDYFKNYFSYYHNQGCEYPPPTMYYLHPTTDASSSANESDVPANCGVIRLPINSSKNDSHQLFDLLTPEFTVEWNVSEACYQCYHRGGQCFHNTRNEFICKKENSRSKDITLIGCGMIIAALTSTLIIVYTIIRKKRAKEERELDNGIELFLKSNRNLAPMRYKYSTVKKMTNSFSENLGRGGFGSVYKGELPDDGHLVAVKVLNESKNGNGEDFMNEVDCISRTSHINIVPLLGYCFEGSKRVLIYDFMPNGSLEKFIGNDASSAELGLGWDKLFEIALGIAQGLEYLHQGCNTRILHLDIKPQNILLDKDMNPRISDFGLAKLCPNRSSVVSMMMARGTIGYIAPEVFSRNFGEVSYKSDVYSYGMLVLEMVGARRSIDRRDVDRSSEIYFPHYLYKQVEMNEERDGNLGGTMDEEDEIFQPVKRNLIIVGLWCVQTNPKDRPSMTKVVEMLEGKLGSLKVPPKPYLYSPPKSEPSYSTSDQSL